MQEGNGDQHSEKLSPENEVEKDEEEVEEYDSEENEDVQSFVTALDNEDDRITESINGLNLGHDNDGKQFNIYIFIRSIFYVFVKVGLLHRMSKLSNPKL